MCCLLTSKRLSHGVAMDRPWLADGPWSEDVLWIDDWTRGKCRAMAWMDGRMYGHSTNPRAVAGAQARTYKETVIENIFK